MLAAGFHIVVLQRFWWLRPRKRKLIACS